MNPHQEAKRRAKAARRRAEEAERLAAREAAMPLAGGTLHRINGYGQEQAFIDGAWRNVRVVHHNTDVDPVIGAAAILGALRRRR